ncbi:MAG: NPXTG-anchored protein [Eubacterium sp.]|nr:NPXTG-anchored protein [Eubacterium sp.]
MNKTAKKNIIVLLATLVFTLAFATTCFAKSSPTATVIPTTTIQPTTTALTTVKPTKNNETTKKKQKKQETTKKDETTTGSDKTGKRNSSDISPKTGSNIIIPIAGLLVAAGAIVVSRKELTDKN